MFTTGNYKIKFSYESYPFITESGEQSIARITWCEIIQVEDDEEKSLIKAGVTCYFKDVYNKVIGRKKALASALDYLKREYSFSKEKRTAIWNKYLELSPRSKMV